MSSLARTTSPAAAAQGDRVLVIPLGATEQHGPHLPLTTDTDIASALAAGLAARRPGVVVAPPLPYGASDEHEAFAGTLTLGAEATERLLIALGRSAARTWRRVLLLSAHGGNAGPLQRAVRTLRAEGHDVRAWSPPAAGDAHAGHVETSIMLHLRPGSVELGAAEPGALAPLATLMPVLRAAGVAAASPNGVLGDPTAASAADGARLVAAALADLEASVEDWPEAGG